MLKAKILEMVKNKLWFFKSLRLRGIDMFESKNVVVTGGAGMVGRALVAKLLNLGANVTVADLHKPSDLEPEVNYYFEDLIYKEKRHLRFYIMFLFVLIY